MISEFRVKNFLSFKEEQILSFEATSDQNNEDYYCIEIKEGVRLLKTAVIYGANASGKTNLLESLNFLRELILRSPKDKNKEIGVDPFLLDDYSKNERTSFSISFFIKEIKFIYTLSLDDKRIYEENLLYYPSVQPAKLYVRTYNEKSDSTEIIFGSHLKLGKKDRLIIIGNTLNNCTVLASFGKSNVASSLLNEIFEYFAHTMKDILRPNSDLSDFTIKALEKEPEMKNFILSLLFESDFNISNLEIQKDDLVITPEVAKMIENSPIPEDIKKGYLEKGKIENPELVYTHKTGKGFYLLPEGAESRGTIRYTGMATILYRLIKQEAILPIDEIESSLHFELISYFIKLFLVNGEKYSQLIFTTHDINLLDEDFIRRDTVWFAEKNEEGETSLERLSDKGLHKNTSPYNAYRQGKLGAKPFMGNIFIN